MNGCFTLGFKGARALPAVQPLQMLWHLFSYLFIFPQDQGQKENGNKSLTFTVGRGGGGKKEERERKGFKIRHRWENMNILAKKARQKGTEPHP